MRVLTFLGLTALLLWHDDGGQSVLRAQGKAKAKANADAETPPTTPFSALVRKHFDAWDLDHDGKLTSEELGILFVRPFLKGDKAAVLACLKELEREALWAGKTPTPFTLDDLRKYEADKAAKRKVKLDLDVDFLDYKDRIAKTPRTLFPEKVPKLTAVKQSGEMADCFFLCVVGAMVHHRADEVCRMIETKDGGKHFTVHFGGAPKPITIVAPTDAEIALNTTALENGLWLSVLEKAYCSRVNRKRPKDERKKSPTDVHGSSGGGSGDAIAFFTGHDCAGFERTDPRLLGMVTAGLANRCMITAVVRAKIKAPPGLRQGHVFSIIGMDRIAGTVAVFDPYGDNFTPKGNPGRGNGYERKNGVMSVPWRDYIEVFDGALVEDKNSKAKF
jgi:hypothetical protein